MTIKNIIQTHRLTLEPFAAHHLDGLTKLGADESVMRFLGGVQTREETLESIHRVQARWEKYGHSWWAIFLKGTDTLIGSACLQHLAHDETEPLEIGWRLLPEFQGQGYATEAGRAAMEFGFTTVGVEYICAVADPNNIASCKVMERLGMTYSGVKTYYDTPCAFYEIRKEDR